MNELEYSRIKELYLSKSIKRFPHPHGRKRLYTTNSPQELAAFAKGFDLLMTYKLAGQPITLTYKNGALISASICNDGVTGYDVTSTLKELNDIPEHISDNDIVEIQGTLIIPWIAYNELIDTGNYTMENNSPWKLIRLLALILDSQALAATKAEFITYDLNGITEYDKKLDILKKLKMLGFQVIEYHPIMKTLTPIEIDDLQTEYTPYDTEYPVTGLVFETDQLFTSCFDLNTRRIIGLDWPYDVRNKEFIRTRRLLANLESI